MEEPDAKKSIFDTLGNAFSTHPGTEDRIKLIEPLPAGQSPVQIMSEEQWKALKAICG